MERTRSDVPQTPVLETERTRCCEQRSNERVLLSLRPIHGRKVDPPADEDAAAAAEDDEVVGVDEVNERLINSGDGATDAAFWRRCDAGASLNRPNVHALDPFEMEPLCSENAHNILKSVNTVQN